MEGKFSLRKAGAQLVTRKIRVKSAPCSCAIDSLRENGFNESIMEYPLTLTFKVLAFAPQISVTDAANNEICHVRQKLFKLKEKISVFTNAQKQDLVCEIHADRVIDFSASYSFMDQGRSFGSLKRRGMKSLWRSHYEICDGDNCKYTVTEGNPWAKVFDGLLGNVPILGMFAGYFFQPRYEVKNTSGEICYTLAKKPAFLEGRFSIEETVNQEDDILVLMALMMITLLERKRG